MTRPGVMHIVDTLEMGGAERVAVNLVNNLPRDRYTPYLCTTRREGQLADLLLPDVGRLRLNRTHRFDADAVHKLHTFIQANDIRILHAHGASLFVARIAAMFLSRPQLIWHDHFGRCGVEERPAWLYRMAVHGAGGVIAVNELLAEWSRSRLLMPADRVWYVPNFVCEGDEIKSDPSLPGIPGCRIVCVANLRPQKDHLNLIRAFALVAREAPDAHLLLVGPASDEQYLHAVRSEIAANHFEQNVTLLGQRTDVNTILSGCDLAVLGSLSEGLPLALLEYGRAGLATVATNVGQCSEVLDEGDAGLLVPPSSPVELAAAMLSLLRSPERRANLGARLRQRVINVYSAESAMRQVCKAYDMILNLEARRN